MGKSIRGIFVSTVSAGGGNPAPARAVGNHISKYFSKMQNREVLSIVLVNGDHNILGQRGM